MSFDLFLVHLQDGEPAPADRQAVLDVVRRHTDASGDQFGFYNVPFDDGSHVELSTKTLESDDAFTDCAFHLRSFTAPVIGFVYDIAMAGDFMLVNPQGGGSDESPATIIVTEAQRRHLWEGCENPRLVASAEELGQVLGCDVAAWQAYRNQVVASRGN